MAGALFRTIRSTKTLPSYSPSSASVIADYHKFSIVTTDEATGDSQQHPWQEWMTFVDRLKAKGYIIQEGRKKPAVYKNMTVLKDACVNFGRDRFDLFRSLSVKDIRPLVAKGCPNTERKTVKSGKRLRAHLQFVEADSCSVCVFRGSCERANVILKDVESGARTVDVVRILLNYALDPAVDFGKKPFGEVIEASARKLLTRLTELSYSQVDPEVLKPATSVTRKAQSFPSVIDEMKRGDWICSKCKFVNFARNRSCRGCNEDGPDTVGHALAEMKKGDWVCPECRFMNFTINITCLRCRCYRPNKPLKPGQWVCPWCSRYNSGGNINCRKCKRERPIN